MVDGYLVGRDWVLYIISDQQLTTVFLLIFNELFQYFAKYTYLFSCHELDERSMPLLCLFARYGARARTLSIKTGSRGKQLDWLCLSATLKLTN